jgi:hypothetical protein
MKIAAVTAPDAASDPAHPDHDAWVKDHTLKMEIEHAKRVGIPLRVAEAENQRLLERSARIARETSKPKKPKPAPRTTRQQRHRQRSVTIRAAKPIVPGAAMSPCGRCGVCRRCMRERRILKIIQKGRAGDQFMFSLALEMTATLMNAMNCRGPFKDLSPADSDRMVANAAESICDRSIRWLGEWR